MALKEFSANLGNEFTYNPSLNSLLTSNDTSLAIDASLSKDIVYYDNGLDSGVNDYLNSTSSSGLHHHFDVGKTLDKDIEDISLNVEGILATGGYVALMEYYKNNPDKQKKITKVAIGLGLLDTFIEKGANGIEADFALSPLLIASLAYFITDLSKDSKNPKIQKLAMQFSDLLGKSMKVVEYTGYAALTISAIVTLSEVGVLGEYGDDILDLMGTLGNATSLVEDGIDLFAGLGLGFLMKQGVKSLSEFLGKENAEKLENLSKSTASKRALVALLNANAPLMVILAPYNDVYNKK